MILTDNILYNLVENSDFYRKVFPYLKSEFFGDRHDSLVFIKIKEYSDKYSKSPTLNDLKLSVEIDNGISEKDSAALYVKIDGLKDIEKVDTEYLVKETEKWAQNRSLEIAIIDSVEIIENPKKAKGEIEEKIREALALQFNIDTGHDYFKDAISRYDAYVTEEEVIPHRISTMNQILKGGWRRKSIYIWLGRTGVGKTIILCDCSASLIEKGLNVLYLSGEMAEKTGIGKRIDANLLDIEMDELGIKLDKKKFTSRLQEVYKRGAGRLFIRQVPAGSYNALHTRSLIQEIKSKNGIKIDALVVDYINLFGTHRLPQNAMSNSYLWVKTVAEDFRGIAIEFDIPVISATQTNRTGSKATSGDMGLDGTSESYGLNSTVDWMGGIIQTPELFEQGKYLIKNLKSRFGDNINEIYTLMVRRNMMRLSDPEEHEKEIPIVIKDRLRMQQEEIKKKQNNEPLVGFDFGEG